MFWAMGITRGRHNNISRICREIRNRVKGEKRDRTQRKTKMVKGKSSAVGNSTSSPSEGENWIVFHLLMICRRLHTEMKESGGKESEKKGFKGPSERSTYRSRTPRPRLDTPVKIYRKILLLIYSSLPHQVRTQSCSNEQRLQLL